MIENDLDYFFTKIQFKLWSFAFPESTPRKCMNDAYSYMHVHMYTDTIVLSQFNRW